MNCPKCSAANPDNAFFCNKCGTMMYGYVPLNSLFLSVPKERIVNAVKARRQSDFVLSPVWAFVPTITTAVGIFISVLTSLLTMSGLGSGLFGGSGAAITSNLMWISIVSTAWGMIGGVILAILANKLVSRESLHYARERKLRRAVLDFIIAAAGTPERKGQLAADISAASTKESDDEKRRDPVLWALVFIVPNMISGLYGLASLSSLNSTHLDLMSMMTIAMIGILVLLLSLVGLILEFYMFHFLGKSLMEHEFRWNMFSANTNRIFAKLGFPAQERFTESKIHVRSTAVYVILSIFTGGLFVLYWWYCLVKDPNEHFEQQRNFENFLLRSMK